MGQPPLGGCVLKLETLKTNTITHTQPPLGGCVLKRLYRRGRGASYRQPPLGGCVLKLRYKNLLLRHNVPAAFRRLCVETAI